MFLKSTTSGDGCSSEPIEAMKKKGYAPIGASDYREFVPGDGLHNCTQAILASLDIAACEIVLKAIVQVAAQAVQRPSVKHVVDSGVDSSQSPLR